MLPIVLAALLNASDTGAPIADHPEVLVEQCGRRLVADADYDLGRELVYVQDISTDEIVYSENVAEWSTAEDYAHTINICQIAG